MATDTSASFGLDRPLAEAIASHTRSVHAKLNKLIIAKLPMALPPQASDCTAYVTGLLHVAPVYITFEALWQSILDSPPTGGPSGNDKDGNGIDESFDSGGTFAAGHDEGHGARRPLLDGRVRLVLQHLHLPGLMRSKRLRADIAELTGWSDHVVEEQLRAASRMGRLGSFVSHIKRAIENRPHILVAYSYILFMALFAGGRFMRASLESAGMGFWEKTPSPMKPTMYSSQKNESTDHHDGVNDGEKTEQTQRKYRHVPLRFFHFSSAVDGEDLKREFKKRLSESESNLTEKEKHDILQEAVCIFDNMALVVQQLDLLCAELTNDDSDTEASLDTLQDLIKNPLGTRFRDSVAVTRERRARSSSKRSSGDEKGTYSYQTANQERTIDVVSQARDSGVVHHTIHPAVPGLPNVELCPGLSKSMKFDKDMPKPGRPPQAREDTGADVVGSLKRVIQRAHSIHPTNWAMVAAFGVIILGVLFTSSRGVIES